MKKLIIVLALLSMIGCAQTRKDMRDSQWWEHDTWYSNWQHWGYSWYGYKYWTDQEIITTPGDDWWGLESRKIKIK